MPLSACLYLALCALEIATIAFGNPSFPIGQAGEDGSFYVQIAQNIALGHGVTFDQIAPTNGIHWLWLFFLSGALKIIGSPWISDTVALFRIAGVAYFLPLSFCGLLVAFEAGWLAAIAFVAYLANRGHWYMETSIVLATLAYAIRSPSPLAGFLLVLGRTDTVLLALFCLRRPLALGALIGFAAVCALNYWVDGSFISVSAQIKSTGWNNWGDLYRAAHDLGLYYFPVLPILCILALWSPDRWFIASCALLTVHILHNSECQGWYLAPVFLTSFLCACRVVRRLGPWLGESGRNLCLCAVHPGH